jgi:PhnB protein
LRAQGIPAEYPRISMTLCVEDAKKAIALYRDLFGAEEQMVLIDDDGRVRHAQLRLADSLILVTDEYPEEGTLSAHSIGGSPVTMLVYVADVDEVFARAMQAGCKALKPVRDQFYGERTGKFLDPHGQRWSVATRFEDVPLDEIADRWSRR